MDKLLIYFLESSLVLAILYGVYLLILRKETFFALNRFYLISILLLSLILPLLSFDFNSQKFASVEAPLGEIRKARTSYHDAFEEWSFQQNIAPIEGAAGTVDLPYFSTLNWKLTLSWILIVGYLTGVVFCISKTIWSLRWIYGLIRENPQEEYDDLVIVRLTTPIAPFSFTNYVFVHEGVCNSNEFDQILAHERTHVRQKHSYDLIFVQLLAALTWFNPVIWRLIKSLKTTHEYIADNKIINEGYSLVEYQTLLLRQLISNNSYGLVHNFNLSFIKKRITMMTNKKSGWTGKVKVALALMSTLAFGTVMVQCNSTAAEQVSMNTEQQLAEVFSQGIDLPTLPKIGYVFDSKGKNIVDLSIANDKFTIDGQTLQLSEVVPLLEKRETTGISDIIVLRIDRTQTMSFVSDVWQELRKADRLRVLYLGKATDGKKVELPILLSPTAANGKVEMVPISMLDPEIDLLKINMEDYVGDAAQQRVVDFVKGHIKKNSSEYAVLISYEETDTYGNFLSNLIYAHEGFTEIYQERAQQMFEQDFYELEKEDYRAVRNGIPRAIIIDPIADADGTR